MLALFTGFLVVRVYKFINMHAQGQGRRFPSLFPFPAADVWLLLLLLHVLDLATNLECVWQASAGPPIGMMRATADRQRAMRNARRDAKAAAAIKRGVGRTRAERKLSKDTIHENRIPTTTPCRPRLHRRKQQSVPPQIPDLATQIFLRHRHLLI
jgi:hypothetical protein